MFFFVFFEIPRLRLNLLDFKKNPFSAYSEASENSSRRLVGETLLDEKGTYEKIEHKLNVKERW